MEEQMIVRHACKRCAVPVAVTVLLCSFTAARAPAQDSTAERPQINWLNRSEEDWSALADRSLTIGPFDSLKYVPLGVDSDSYLSFGLTTRQRIESSSFRLGIIGEDAYLLSRLQAHADVRLRSRVQLFVQVADYRAPGAGLKTPVDQNRLDVEQAFAGVAFTVGPGTLLVRLGRQEVPLDRQRFISNRDGPNVRQPVDALCVIYDSATWRLAGYYTQPVQTIDGSAFDDSSSRRLTFSGVRVERRRFAGGVVSLYFASLRDASAASVAITGRETRHVFDVRYAGKRGTWDWDVEGMGQGGRLGDKVIRAWGIGSVLGRTFDTDTLSPRLALQGDAASGTTNSHPDRVGTFNPLFPNGSYVTLAGYPGYANFLHVKPSVTLQPTRSTSIVLAGAGLWRATTSDAIYVLPAMPVPGSSGRPGAYSGSYAQVRAEWRLSPHLTSTLELDRFWHGDVLRSSGANDGHYASLDLRFAF
jgi:hypothetical protein